MGFSTIGGFERRKKGNEGDGKEVAAQKTEE